MTTTCPHPEKYRHVSKAAALAHLASLERAGRGDQTIRPYPCHDHWHLGHKGAGSLNRQLKRALRQGKKAARASRRRRTR